MKVLFLSAACSIHTIRWVNAISTCGHEVVLVSQKDHRAVKGLISDKVRIVYLPVTGMKGYYLNALALRKVWKAEKFDVINVHYASGYGTLARIARLPHILLSVWGSDVYDFPYESRLKMQIIQKNLRYAKRIASTSHVMEKQVKRLIGTCEIAVTPFGVDTELFKKSPRNPNEIFTVGIVKTLSSKYGIDMVIKAFAIFLKQLPGANQNVRLIIYGKGEDKTALKNLCIREQVEDKVVFQGYIPNQEVPKALNEMDVCCFGSRLESFGVAAVEAMSCEVPVIVTDVDGFQEVVEHGKTGYIVPRDCPEAMAEYLLKLYQSEDLRRSMGENGRKRVMELYDWERNVETMLKLYRRKG